MSNLLEAIRFETRSFASGPAPTTATTSAGQLTGLELLSAWGAVRGADRRDPRSAFERRRLAVRGTRVRRRPLPAQLRVGAAE